MRTKYLRCLLLVVFLLVAITMFAPNTVQAVNDTTPPEILDIQVQQTWDTTSNKVTFKIPEGLDTLKRVSVTDSNGNSVRFAQSNGLYSLTITANGTYTITAVDRAGNQQVKTFTVDKIDTETPMKPNIEANGLGAWTNQNIDITLSSIDSQSGIAAYWYSTADSQFDKNTWTRIAPSFGLGKLLLAKEQSATYFFVAEDRVGRISNTSSISVKIDKTPATGLTLQYATDSNSGYVRTLNGTNIYKDKLTFSAKATDKLSGIAYYEYRVDSSRYSSGWIKVTAQEQGFTKDFTGANGQYTVSVRVYDNAGNVSEVARLPACVLENTGTAITAPTVTATAAGKAYNGAWTRNDVKLTVSGSSAISGIEYYEYRVDYLDPNISDLSWKKVPVAGGIASVLQNTDTKGSIYFRAVSYAGVSSQMASVIVQIQKTAPAAATIKPSTAASATGWYTKLPSYTVVTPAQSGFTAPVKYIINYSFNGKEQAAVTYNGKNAPKINADGTWTFKVTAVDDAGNTTVAANVVIFKVDTKAPVISGQYDNNNVTASLGGVEGFTAARTLTITVTEHNFLASKAIITVKNLDTGETLAYTWTSSGDTHTCKITVAAEGHYAVSASVADAAGNKVKKIAFVSGTKAPDNFLMDATPAQITVSYDNNDAQNDKFFAAARTLTITVVERNFDPEKITVMLLFSPVNGEEALLAIEQWHHDGYAHTATILLDQDGTYTITVTGEDLMGNVTADANYEGSAPKEWVLDTQLSSPLIEQTTGAAGNTVAPQITVMDPYLDTISVKLLYTSLYEKNIDVTAKLLTEEVLNWKSIEGGKELLLDIYPRDQKMDGEYTLIVTVTDMAGNKADTTYTFYVNYHGSIYIYDEYLISLRNGYFTDIGKDLIIIEYSPAGLQEGSALVQILLNGSIQSRPVYSVEPTNTDENGWKELRYVISASNFTEEGIYSVVISSRNTSGNISENTSEEAKIRFAVDRTVPELPSIIGMQNAVVTGNKQVVSLQVMDNVALDRITVYINGKKVKNWSDLTGYAADCDFTIPVGEKQKIRIVAVDKAGNVLDTDAADFAPAYGFNRVITVKTNSLLQLYDNKPLFYGCIAGAVLLLAGSIVLFIVLGRKKKKTEE